MERRLSDLKCKSPHLRTKLSRENTQKETQRRTQPPKHPEDRCEPMKNLVVQVQDFDAKNGSNSRRVTEQVDSSAPIESTQPSYWTTSNWTITNCGDKQRLKNNLTGDFNSNEKSEKSGKKVSSAVESSRDLGRVDKNNDIMKEVPDKTSTNPKKDNIINTSDLHPSEKDPKSNKDCLETKKVKVENNDEKGGERNNVAETISTSKIPPKENVTVIKEVTGLIFQFSPEAILFEFTLEEGSECGVGIVNPGNVRIGDGNIPPAALKTKEALGRYIEVGDELVCKVVKEEGMGMVSVQEEDEEGAMVEVEIQPDWRAR